MVMPYHLHMPSYFLETFTEYPLLYFTVLLYFLLAMLLFPGAADFSGWQAFL